MAIEDFDQVTIAPAKLRPFSKFIMSIGELPTSYLDSLSYAEQVTWFCDYLQNNVIPTIDNNAEALEEVQGLMTQLQEYVSDYFTNLDVQEEINNKLDQMALDGTLTSLISTYLNPLVEDQNARIDNIETMVNSVASGSPLVASSTSGMTDTSRVYVNTSNGKWYYYNGTTWAIGGTYQSTGIANNSITYDKLKNNILKGQNMKYLLTNYKMNSVEDYFANNFNLYSQGSVSTSAVIERITNWGYMSFDNNPVFKPIDDNINYFVNVYRPKEKQAGSFDFSTLDLEQGGINTSGNLVNSTYQVRTSDYITVESNTLFESDINCYPAYVFKYDSENNYQERIDLNTYDHTSTTLSPSYKYKVVFVCNSNVTGLDITPNVDKYITQIKSNTLTEMYDQVTAGWHDYTLTYENSSNLLYKVCLRKKNSAYFSSTDKLCDYILISDDLTTPLQNKTISVLGDSFSAFRDIIPNTNTPYYYGNNAGVTNYNEMWWQRLINNNGANRGVIQASSGSNVSYIREQSLCLSNTNMCQALGTPDIIIILGGTNDFSHTPALLGTYDGTGSFPTDNNNFSNAYALMLNRILTSYPNATVFCCSIPAFVRTNLDKTQPEQNTETNGEHKTIADYSNRIKRIAEIFNCQYIDMNEFGYNRTNYYPTYCQDSDTNSTHPNAKGQEVIFKCIEKKVLSVLNNLV